MANTTFGAQGLLQVISLKRKKGAKPECQMSKLKVQMNFRISKFKLELAYYLAFDIHLAFGF